MTYTKLSETVELMNSADYKERFVAEYVQTKIRHLKLVRMLKQYDEGTLEFEPTCPVAVLKQQRLFMAWLLDRLVYRAEMEGIELPPVEVEA